MKKILVLCLAAAALAGTALARNDELKMPWSDVIDGPEGKARLDGSVRFLFGEKTLPAGAERKGEEIISRIKKGASRNDDKTACRLAAVDALGAMQDKAKQIGANAVVDLVSYYKNNTFSSATHYECHAGGTGGHLTFKATYANIPAK